MKRALIINLILMLFKQFVFCQTSDIYRITNNTDTEINFLQFDSVKEVIFDGSVIENLDNNWERFIHVKQITFTNNAKIPSNLHIISNANKLSFSNYDSIYFPADFPYLNFIDISVVGVMKTPSEITKFKNLEIVFSNETGGHSIINYLLSLRKIKNVIISATQDTINADFCSLIQLEKMHLHDVKFEFDILDLSCLKHLSFLHISESNLVNLIVQGNSLKRLLLENNRISEDRIQELMNTVLKTIKE